jgi:Ca2+-transporting ATPase
MQLLWINLMTDIFPALGLALEPAEPDVLRTRPRDPRQRMLDRRDIPRLLRESLLLSGGALGSYLYAIRRYGAGARASTHVFATLTFAQLLHALSCRSERAGLLDRTGRRRNRALDAALLATAAIQVTALLLPPTRRLLGTSRIGVGDFAAIGLFSAAPLLANEVMNRLQLQVRKDQGDNRRALLQSDTAPGGG